MYRKGIQCGVIPKNQFWESSSVTGRLVGSFGALRLFSDTRLKALSAMPNTTSTDATMGRTLVATLGFTATLPWSNLARKKAISACNQLLIMFNNLL